MPPHFIHEHGRGKSDDRDDLPSVNGLSMSIYAL